VAWLSDPVLNRLREVVDLPEPSGGRYEILERIGRGGMGAVFRARDRQLDRTVALKVLAIELADSTGAAQGLLREARILAYLEHPGVVPVHDS